MIFIAERTFSRIMLNILDHRITGDFYGKITS